MKPLLVALKNIREILREPQMLLLTLLLPAVFVFISAGGYTLPLANTYSVMIAGKDSMAERLTAYLEAQTYADGKPVYAIRRVEEVTSDVEEELKAHKAAVLLEVSAAENGDLAVKVVGDAVYGGFYKASTILNKDVETFARQLNGRNALVQFTEVPIGSMGAKTEFDLYAPGMMIFAFLMIVPQTTMLVSREIRSKTLRRLSLSRLSPFSFLSGVTLGQMLVAVVQVVVVMGLLMVCGYQNRGSVWLVMAVGMAICLSSVGQGLVVAAFIENDSQAANVGSTVAMVQVFLSGAIYQMPPVTLFKLGAHAIDVFDFIPAAHGFLALQQVSTFGFGFSEIAFRLGAVLVLALVYFAIGVLVFRRQWSKA